MSAFRRLTSSFRSERRCEQACPYSRPQPSPPKPKPTRRPRYWDFFNFFSFAAPYTDEEEEEAKKAAEAKAKASQQAEVIVSPEQDSETSDASVSASSTEESTTTTSDSSLETVETAVTAERVEPVEPAKPSEPKQPTRTPELVEPASAQSTEPMEVVEIRAPEQISRSLNTVSSQTPVSSIPLPPQSSSQAVASIPESYSFPPPPPTATTDDEFMEWVRGKYESQTPFNNDDYLGLKAFFERTRGEQPFSPIKLRYPRYAPTSAPPSSDDSALDAVSAQQSVSSDQTPPTAFVNGYHNPTGAIPAYFSGFHSSTSLPTFKNNVKTVRPRRMLQKDPNGSITYRGAGSVRNTAEEGRKRPAPLVKLRFDPYKRRRLFDEAKGPVAAPDAASLRSTLAGASVPSVAPTVSRTGVNHRHATPHSPSPLRNVINGSPPSSHKPTQTMPTNLNATSSRSVPANQTASAAFLQEAVERVAPRRPRYSDIVNPYQTAAPVKPVVKPMEKRRISERRARTKESEKQKEAAKMKETEKRELSVKEIIEATVPKGATRSRPPPNLAKSKAASASVSGFANKRRLDGSEEESVPTKKRRTVTVEEVSEDDDVRERSYPVRPNVIIESRSPSPDPISAISRPVRAESLTKETFIKERSSKEASARTAATSQSTTKEAPLRSTQAREFAKVLPTKEHHPKIQPVKEPSHKVSSSKASTKNSSARGPSNHFSPLLNAKMTGKSSTPREPSKLRTSFLPDECENEEPKMASPTPSATVTMTTPGTPLADIQEKKDPKEVALTLPLNDLPSFIFKTPPALTAGDHTDARVAAKELPITSLPKFDFSKARTTMNGLLFPAVPIPTIKPFVFEAAGAKSSPSSDAQWQCPTCMLQNAASAVEKCSVCEAPRPGVEKPKKASANGINGVDGAKNLNGKVPSSKSKSTFSMCTDVKGFNFAAAGLTPKVSVADGQWTCSNCMLQNPATAVEKCIVCDSPRPEAKTTEKLEKPKKPYMNGGAHLPKPLTNGIVPPTVKSFDFAAAGLAPKAPVAKNNWYCPTCMLQNPATALEKCKVCDSPRPGTEKRAVQLPVVPVKLPQFVPKSFDWAGAGLVPKFNGSSWTCGTCMLSNPPTENEKCKVCDTSRS